MVQSRRQTGVTNMALQFDNRIGPAFVVTVAGWLVGGGMLYSEIKATAAVATQTAVKVEKIREEQSTIRERTTERLGKMETVITFIQDSLKRFETKIDGNK